MVESYIISQSNTNTDCFNDSDDITGIVASETMYTLTDLQEGTEYSITVTATLSDGETAEDNLTATTMTAGWYIHHVTSHTCLNSEYLTSRSICCSYFCECICSDLLQHHCPVGGSGLHPPQWRHNRLLSAIWGGGEWEYTDYECLRR